VYAMLWLLCCTYLHLGLLYLCKCPIIPVFCAQGFALGEVLFFNLLPIYVN